jgi:hypothetical protein
MRKLNQGPLLLVLRYLLYGLAVAVVAPLFDAVEFHRWVAWLSNKPEHELPGFQEVYPPALYLTGALWLSVMVRIRFKILWFSAALGHGLVLAIACYFLVHLFDANYEQQLNFLRYLTWIEHIKWYLFIGGFALLGWLYSLILWTTFNALLRVVDLRWPGIHPGRRRLSSSKAAAV